MKKKILLKLLLSALLVGSLTLAGCSGDDGSDGATGATGPQGPPGAVRAAEETCTVCHAEERLADVAEFHGLNDVSGTVTVSNIVPTITTNIDGTVTTSVTLDFAAVDANGNPVAVDLTDASGTRLAYVRFSLAKLVPGLAGDPDSWFDYYNGERDLADVVATDNGDGSFTFAIDNDIAADYDPTTTHRIALQIGGLPATLPVANPTFDFVPNGSPVTLTRDIARIEACNECHDPLAFHGGGRIDVKYCVVCHNPTMANGEGDMAFMTHKIHAAGTFAVLDDAIDYSEVTYPQDLRNCDKCHTGADGDNWKSVPSITACGSCHDDLDFATHQGGQANNSACASCHTVAAIELAHVTENSTPNNLAVPAGAVNFEYVINSVTVNANNAAVVDFTILKDGVPLDLSTYPPAGFTGGPSFLVAYALPQDGIAAPADYNNRGRNEAQPASVSIASVASGLTAGATAGSYVATLASAPFPANSTLRAIALQGYFTQVTPAVARHTPSVMKAVTGDVVRRQVVDSNKCLECHEIIEGHGGNRVNNVQVCVFCHVPNLSSSGRAADPAGLPQATIDAVGSNPLLFPEATQNMKDMIHGIHASAFRTVDYEHVRNRSGGLYYNWAEVTYPGTLNNCTKCHIGETYRPETIPAGALATTNVTTDGVNASRADVIAARGGVPNATDEVISPVSATCVSCHTVGVTKEHMLLNGAGFGARADVIGE